MLNCLIGSCVFYGDEDIDNKIFAKKLNIYTQSKGNVEYDSLSLYQGIYDTVYINSDDINDESNISDKVIPSEWLNDTIFWAKFDHNLQAGQSDLELNNISYVIIQKKEENENSYSVVDVIPVKDYISNNKITVIDRLVKCYKSYDYQIVPVMIDGTESTTLKAVYTTDKKIEWNGYFIYDGNTEYFCKFGEQTIDYTRNNSAQVQTTMNTDYPYVIKSGMNKHDTVTVSASDFKVDCSKEGGLDLEGSAEYRRKYDDFLSNSNPKLFRDDQGNMRICAVYDGISHSEQGHKFNVDTSYNLCEIGNADSPEDLYSYGFSNYNPNTMMGNNITSELVQGATLNITVYGAISGDTISNIQVSLCLNDVEIFGGKTNTNGKFTLCNLDSGRYSIVIHNGIYTVKKPISISSSGVINIDLEVGGV